MCPLGVSEVLYQLYFATRSSIGKCMKNEERVLNNIIILINNEMFLFFTDPPKVDVPYEREPGTE